MIMYAFYRTPTVCACLTAMLIAVLLPSLAWAQAETDPTREPAASGRSLSGLGVFGEGLGVHESDTLTVWGDLVLEKAEVAGKGTLKLRGHRPAQIVAHRSTVPTVHVANATRVTLHGDLRVTQQLTVETGTLDARPGTLRLPGADHVALGPSGKLLLSATDAVSATQPRAGLTGSQQPDAERTTGLVWPTGNRREERTRPVEGYQPFRMESYRQEPTPPPERQTA